MGREYEVRGVRSDMVRQLPRYRYRTYLGRYRTCHAFFLVGFVKVLLQSQLLGDEVLDVALKVKTPKKFNLACSEKNR